MSRLMQIALAGAAGAALVGFLGRSRWGNDAFLYGAIGGLALGTLVTTGPVFSGGVLGPPAGEAQF